MIALRQRRATTAQMCTLYPFSVGAGGDSRGVLIGRDLLAGGAGFFFDPFEAYASGRVTNPNIFTVGVPGMAKSTLVKTALWRMWAVYGRNRYFAILDPKGEYAPLAHAMGMKVIRLRPGGQTRINPMDGVSSGEGRFERQLSLVLSLFETTANRTVGARLTTQERTALRAAVRVASARAGSTLLDVVALLREPVDASVSAASVTRERLIEFGERAAQLGDELMSGPLAGMFDGPTTEKLSFGDAGVVVDLSAVHADETALPLVMLATTGWLTELREMAAQGKQWIQVLDEMWALLGSETAAAHVQSSLKLGRTHGVATWMITHRISDLGAQAADGSAAQKISDGLLADAATRIVLRQSPDQLGMAGDRLGLNPEQQRAIGVLPRGRALWTVGDETLLVQHVLTHRELALVDTDANMRGRG